jgi:predicted enzyme related to lactoylglutathione lyase
MASESRFFWHDLMASDVEGAKRFYGELFGWRFERGDGGYEHIYAGDVGIGGMMKLDPKTGAPPYWLGYVKVSDIDQTIASATKAGAKTFVPKTNVPNVGPFAVLADPTGGVFAPMHYTGKDANKPEPDMGPAPYQFCWDELLTSDPDAAVKFYSALFGWRAEHMDMPGGFRYTLLTRDLKDSKGNPRHAAGLMKRPPEVPMTFWLTYVQVPNLDQTIEKAKKFGATITSPPMEVPNVGRFTTILDPQHAAIAILQPAK